ncbi:MAG: tetratricopeptide repeat protein [Euzebyaceae bacterium]|nr:tetratricopeptide repeat protein [Euzebyaceae bacterium]
MATLMGRPTTDPGADPGPSHGSEQGAASRPPLGFRRLLTAAVVLLIAGLALGRFVLFDAAPAAAPPPPPAQTTADVVAQLERQIEQNPQDLSALQALGAAYSRQAGETGDPARYQLAETAFERAEALDPGNPLTTVARGNLALLLHDFDAALELGRDAVAELPMNEAALAIVVDAEVELGRYDDAAETLQRMLDRNPALPALARTSYLRELHGDLPSAVQAMQQALAAGALAGYDVASVAALLGDLHYKRGDLAEAEAAYDRAERLYPGLPTAAIGHARLLAANGDRPAAIEMLREVTDRAPLPAALVLRSDLLTLEGRADEAADVDDLVRAVAVLQEDAGQAVDLEMALFEADRADDPQRAVELARQAHDARPDNVFAADALAWALHRAGDSAAALPYVDQALRLDAADPLLRFHAAAVRAATGDDAAARADLQRTFDLTPWFSFALADEAVELADRLGIEVPAELDALGAAAG